MEYIASWPGQYDGYGILHDKQKNQIIINLPQTPRTAVDTVKPVSKRKIELTDSEMILLLNLTRYMFEGGKDDG